jgi:uncharacterized protein (DUF2062 family)
VVDPIVAQLTQGLTPHKIALTIAIGSALSMFPILGTTTLLCLLIGIGMRLNQPIIQAVNYACTPIHLTFIFYAFRWGDQLFGTTHTRWEFRGMMRLLHEHPVDFMTTYSMTAVHAIVLWAVLVPFWSTAIYYVMLPMMRGIDKVRVETASKTAAEKAKEHPVP